MSLHAGRPNYAENQRVVAEMSMLNEVAAGAARSAEALTQPDGRDADAEIWRLAHQHKRPLIA